MIFNVVKAAEGFSKYGDGEGSHTLIFEVVPKDREQLDIGDDYVLIGSGYHRFKATDRQLVQAKVSVTADSSYLGDVEWDRPICGTASFLEGFGDQIQSFAAALTITVVVEPDILNAMARTQIAGPGAATISVDIKGLEYGNGFDGSHQIWKLGGKKDDLSRKPVTHFWFNANSFSTTEQAIFEAGERHLNERLAASSDPDDRKLAASNQAKKPDPVVALLRQCRWLLIALLALGALSLGSCSQSPSDDCLDLPVDVPTGITDLKQEVYVCVERNAAMYAKGPDSPEALSRAVIARCKPAINRFLEQEGRAADGSLQYNMALEQWRQHSLPIIAEARARRCYS